MKADILARVRANKPAALPHPGTAAPRPTVEESIRRFTGSAGLSATKVVVLAQGESLAELLQALHPDATRLANQIRAERSPDLHLATDPRWANAPRYSGGASIADLAAVQLAVLPAQFAVIENGACWLSETDMGHRALPFSTEHLVLVLPRPKGNQASLVETMHEAYARVPAGSSEFGCFIAGPSKTADIEQSLVIGAQGPRSLTVVFTPTT